MPYVFVAVAIVLEIAATSLLPRTQGFTKLGPTLAVVAGYVVCFWLVAKAVQTLEVGVVYAVWSGVGTAAVATIGVVFLKESLSLTKVLGLVLIIGGVVVLNLAGSH